MLLQLMGMLLQQPQHTLATLAPLSEQIDPQAVFLFLFFSMTLQSGGCSSRAYVKTTYKVSEAFCYTMARSKMIVFAYQLGESLLILTVILVASAQCLAVRESQTTRLSDVSSHGQKK